MILGSQHRDTDKGSIGIVLRDHHQVEGEPHKEGVEKKSGQEEYSDL